MLRGIDIVCISSIDWDFIWQGHQEIMSTLAQQGNRVLFIENTGVRSPGFKDLPRLKRRLVNWWQGTKGFRQIQETLFVYSPVILPFPYSREAGWINRRLLFRALRRWMDATGFRRPILWTFLPTPIVRDLIRSIDPELTVYYCIDDLASSSRQAQQIRSSELRLFREADLVFVTSEGLRQRAAQFSRNVHLFPFGVAFEQFAAVRSAPNEVPAVLRRISGPVVGYVGGLHQWVDQELLVEVARQMPETAFVLIGPHQTEVSQLARCANIHLLGSRPHGEMPCYIKGFHVGMIPYRLSDYTAHVYPTKLNEYLAMGIPVVATDLPEIRRFNGEFGDVVAVAKTSEDFAAALRQALRPTPPNLVARRIEVSRQNSWTQRITQMSGLIEGKLAERRQSGRRWEVSLRRVYHAARRRATWVVLGPILSYVLMFHSPIPWWLAEPLRVIEPPRSVDAIVVFAGGVGESGKAGGGYQERVKQAVDLYRQGMASHLIFSSGFTFVFREAEVMKALAVSQGVAASAIILETNAATTAQNVRFVAEILQTHGWDSILLVSSPYHMRRALLTWRKAAPDVRVVPSPVPASQFYIPNRQRGVSLEQLRGVLHEYAAILYYWWQGWI